MARNCRYLSGLLQTSGFRRRLVVDDGRLTEGFVITDMKLWPVEGDQIGDVSVVVATTDDAAVIPMAGDDNRQVAWGYSAADAQGIPMVTIIRPNEIILEELVISAVIGAGYAGGINYLITLEPVTISDAHSALVLINNKSQNMP